MRESLGLVETRGLSNAIVVADAMSKTANINIIGIENSKGLGYMTIKITGDVGAVNAAVACGKQIAIENNSFVTAKVIPRPSNNIEATFCQLEHKKDDNKENMIELSDATNNADEKEENDISSNSVKVVENVEDKAEEKLTEIKEEKVEEAVEVLVKTEDEADNTKEVSANSSGSEIKSSDTPKSKTRRGSGKKADPKKGEE